MCPQAGRAHGAPEVSREVAEHDGGGDTAPVTGHLQPRDKEADRVASDLLGAGQRPHVQRPCSRRATGSPLPTAFAGGGSPLGSAGTCSFTPSLWPLRTGVAQEAAWGLPQCLLGALLQPRTRTRPQDTAAGTTGTAAGGTATCWAEAGTEQGGLPDLPSPGLPRPSPRPHGLPGPQ